MWPKVRKSTEYTEAQTCFLPFSQTMIDFSQSLQKLTLSSETGSKLNSGGTKEKYGMVMMRWS